MPRSKPRTTRPWLMRLGVLALLTLPTVALAGPPITGSLESVHGLRVLKLWGTPEERGYAHGFLLAADIIVGLEDTLLHERIVASPQDYETKVRGQLLRRLRFSPDYRAELEGMLRGITQSLGVDSLRLKRLGRNLDVQDLMAVNSLADWYPFACSSFSAWGELTEGGEMITARNLDFIPLPGMENKHVLIAYVEPGTGRVPWVSVTWPGLIGAYTAMNAEGVTISMHDSEPLQPVASGTCVPRSIVLREAIETARASTAIADVKRTLVKSLAMTGNNIHVSSPFAGQKDPAAVFEYDGSRSKDGGVTQRVSDAKPLPCWLTCTNHYCRRRQPPAPQDHPFDSVGRYNTIAKALGEAMRSHVKIDLAWARRTIGHVAVEGHLLTLHTVFYFPNRKEMYVCLARAGAAAPSFEPVAIRLAELLRK